MCVFVTYIHIYTHMHTSTQLYIHIHICECSCVCVYDIKVKRGLKCTKNQVENVPIHWRLDIIILNATFKNIWDKTMFIT